jgi:hypothetical protein
MQCTCDSTGAFACSPCGGGKPDAGGGGGGGAGGTSTCASGAACQPGQACNGPDPTGSCMQCTCDSTGAFACSPCGGGKPDGGGAPAGDGGTQPPPSDGGSKTCQVNSMPWPGGAAPCRVMEACPDGNSYGVMCDGSTGSCMCMIKGVATGQTPTMSCATFDGMAALAACGFPPGTL